YPFERKNDFYLAWKPYGWDKTRSLLTEMAAILKTEGVPLKVVIFPVVDQMNDQYRKMNEAYVLYPQAQIKRICDDLNIPYFDLTNTLYKHRGASLFADYLHTNERGNALITDELTRYLVGIFLNLPTLSLACP